MSKFNIMETTVAKVQAAYLDGTLTCRELCEDYIARIKAYDHEGPAINSIICVNPKALEEADREAAAAGEVPVGCVIVDRAGQIIGRGRNRRRITLIPPICPPPPAASRWRAGCRIRMPL